MVSACNFLTMILLARYFGIEEFGRFTLAWMAVLISVSLHGTLVIAPMMSIGPKQRADDRPAYFAVLTLQHVYFVTIAFVLILGGTLAFDSLFPSWRAGQLALPLACAALAYNTQEFLRYYFFSKGRVTRAFTTDAIRYPGQLAAFVILAQFAELDVRTGLWIMFAAAATGLAPCIRHFERLRWDRDIARATIVRHWNFSRWLISGTIMNLANAHVFFVVAGALLGASAVGAINATRALLGVTRVVFFGLGNIMPTRAAQHFHEAGVAALTRYLGRVTILLGVLTGSIVIAAAAAPEYWLRLAFGSEYAGFGYLVQWWAVAHLLFAFNMPLRAGLLAIEHTKVIFIASLLSASFGLAFAYGLVTQFDAIGVIAGFIVTTVIHNSTLAISLFRRLNNVHGVTSKAVSGGDKLCH